MWSQAVSSHEPAIVQSSVSSNSHLSIAAVFHFGKIVTNFGTHAAFYFKSDTKLKACGEGATVFVLPQHPLTYRAARFPQNFTN